MGKTIALLFLIVITFGWSMCHSVKEEEKIDKIDNIQTIFFNKPENFTILYTNGNEVIQERYDRIKLKLCNNCLPYLEKKYTIWYNIYDMKFESCGCGNYTLYVPSMQIITGAINVEVGRTKSGPIYNDNFKVYTGE